MVSNIYIDSIMKKIKGYQGTFSSNSAPKLKNNQSAILNFSKYGEEGTHFIAIYIKKNICLYFDPLCINLSFIPKEIKNQLKKYDKIENISRKIQNNSSDFCGFFCMLILISLTFSKKYLFFVLSNFKKDDLNNDKICIKLLTVSIKKYFNYGK